MIIKQNLKFVNVKLQVEKFTLCIIYFSNGWIYEECISLKFESLGTYQAQ